MLMENNLKKKRRSEWVLGGGRRVERAGKTEINRKIIVYRLRPIKEN
jgi:hypothetical protein